MPHLAAGQLTEQQKEAAPSVPAPGTAKGAVSFERPTALPSYQKGEVFAR